MSTTEREIDWKAVERGDVKVRTRGDQIVKDVRVFDDGEVAVRFTNGGWGAYGVRDLDVFERVPPEPKRYTAWLNLYADGGCARHYSKESADSAVFDRLECREITWTVPQ